MRFFLRDRGAARSHLRARALAVGIVGGGLWAAVAHAQVCAPSTYACGDGTCCPVTDLCCIGAESQCCGDDTPYCCDDGTCAISPTACKSSGTITGTDAGCAAYAIPCGAGCIPAGGDCCDDLGHYCPGTETCISATTCSTDDASVPAELVSGTVPTNSPNTSPVVSPLQDPPGAQRESCGVDPGRAAPGGVPLGLGGLLVLGLARRRIALRPEPFVRPGSSLRPDR